MPNISNEVQSQIDRIDNEVGNQTELISQIMTALEGKATGGSTSGGSSDLYPVRIYKNDELVHSVEYPAGSYQIIEVDWTYADEADVVFFDENLISMMNEGVIWSDLWSIIYNPPYLSGWARCTDKGFMGCDVDKIAFVVPKGGAELHVIVDG